MTEEGKKEKRQESAEPHIRNRMHLTVQSLPENAAFVRACTAAFAAQTECTLEELDEIRLAVSEAVSNSIIHGYKNDPRAQVELYITLWADDGMEIIVADRGCGIPDVRRAMEPAFSTEPGHMGLGFAFMRSFMDELEVKSRVGEGTTVILRRRGHRGHPN